MIASCAPVAGNLRDEGFKLVQKAFESLEPSPESPELNETIDLNIRICIVGDRKYFSWDKASAYGSPILGYATRKNEIYVLGKRIGDKIVINQAVLGHELNHILNFENPIIADPDHLDRLE